MLQGLGWDGAMTESLGASLVTLTMSWQTSGGVQWPSRDKGPGGDSYLESFLEGRWELLAQQVPWSLLQAARVIFRSLAA